MTPLQYIIGGLAFALIVLAMLAATLIVLHFASKHWKLTIAFIIAILSLFWL